MLPGGTSFSRTRRATQASPRLELDQSPLVNAASLVCPRVRRRAERRARTALAALLLAAAPALTAGAIAAPPGRLSADDREALGRVAYAEAGSQHEEGLAAVIHAVLNRVAAGRFGAGVQGVIDAPGQFEPVARAGGSWRSLPPLSEQQRVVFGTILELILQGRLPDLTGGSTSFQNAAVVAQRAAQGQVPPNLVNFGGRAPTAVIRDHSFFRDGAGPGHAALPPAAVALAVNAAPASPRAKFIRIGVAARAAGARIRIVRGALPPAP